MSRAPVKPERTAVRSGGTPIEEWRETRFPGYWVSSEGQVLGRSGRILSPAPNQQGYLMVCIPDPSRKHGSGNQRVNVLVCEAFHGPKPGPEYHAAHSNGDLSDNRASNLRWATPKENGVDRVKHGTAACGESNGNTRLKAEQVQAIRSAPQGYGSRLNLASQYGVHPSTIDNIRKGLTWAPR